jgi:uncharacterized membrane protein YoaK (UPF0700 family)
MPSTSRYNRFDIFCPNRLPGHVMSKEPVTAHSALESTLGAGALLSAIGGFLDAYTYIGHGMVFANAQSGNVLFAALAVANAQWSVAIRHIPPIIALFVGTFFVRALQLVGSRLKFRAVSVCLAVESLVLLINAALPVNMSDYPTTVSISFAAALQWSAFAKIEGWAYTSIAATGNLRKLADVLFTLTIGAAPDAATSSRARAFAAICTGFALGAMIGALATHAMGNAAALLPAVCLLGMLLMIDVAARFPS